MIPPMETLTQHVQTIGHTFNTLVESGMAPDQAFGFMVGALFAGVAETRDKEGQDVLRRILRDVAYTDMNDFRMVAQSLEATKGKLPHA